MRFLKKRSIATILLALVLVLSFTSSAFADFSTRMTNPEGTKTSPTAMEGNTDQIFNWLHPSNTTHYRMIITSPFSSTDTGIQPLYSSIPPGSNYGHIILSAYLWNSLPRFTDIQVVILTYHYNPSTGVYEQNGIDDAWFWIVPESEG
ncbi:hypothetical protein [Paenibacillus sp. GYB003]|uniref:hypothetical protein n=1 Tax=Paenibacillus sp. GYB003 TaxID=2994392 RepID=UPI002F964E73